MALVSVNDENGTRRTVMSMWRPRKTSLNS